jgi:hypothetical protein
MPGLGTIYESGRLVRGIADRLSQRTADAWWRLRQRPLPMVLLKDQQPLTTEELERAHAVIDWIEQGIDARPAYLKQYQLSEAIHFPQAIWALEGMGLYDGFRAVLSRDPRVLNYLRLWSQQFTGYRLFSMESAECRPFPGPDEIGVAADRRLAACGATPDLWVGRYERLAARLPQDLRVSPPRKLGEIGWNLDGRTVSYDSYVYLERLALLYECGLLDRLRAIAASGRTPYVVEIGGGFGGLAYYLAQLIPQLRIVIVDIPESLVFSSLSLSLLLPERSYVYATAETTSAALLDERPGCTFVPNYLFDSLLDAGSPFDLAINTLSMSEMDESQVEYYCLGLDHLLSGDGVFFEQNQNNKPVGRLDAQSVIARHFASRQDLRSRLVGLLTQGTAHLWARQSEANPSTPITSPASVESWQLPQQPAPVERTDRIPVNSH